MTKAVQKTKTCAGNGCSRDGIYPLTIVYLNKLGWFCQSCKDDLISEGLAIEDKTKVVGPQRPAPEPTSAQAIPNTQAMNIGNQKNIQQTK